MVFSLFSPSAFCGRPPLLSPVVDADVEVEVFFYPKISSPLKVELISGGIIISLNFKLSFSK